MTINMLFTEADVLELSAMFQECSGVDIDTSGDWLEPIKDGERDWGKLESDRAKALFSVSHWYFVMAMQAHVTAETGHRDQRELARRQFKEFNSKSQLLEGMAWLIVRQEKGCWIVKGVGMRCGSNWQIIEGPEMQPVAG